MDETVDSNNTEDQFLSLGTQRTGQKQYDVLLLASAGKLWVRSLSGSQFLLKGGQLHSICFMSSFHFLFLFFYFKWQPHSW